MSAGRDDWKRLAKIGFTPSEREAWPKATPELRKLLLEQPPSYYAKGGDPGALDAALSKYGKAVSGATLTTKAELEAYMGCDACGGGDATDELAEHMRVKGWLDGSYDADKSFSLNRKLDNEAVSADAKRVVLILANRTPSHPDFERCRRRSIALAGKLSIFPPKWACEYKADLGPRRKWAMSGIIPNKFKEYFTTATGAVVAFILHTIKRCGTYGKSIKETCDILKVSPSTVKRALRIAAATGLLNIQVQAVRNKNGCIIAPNKPNLITVTNLKVRDWINNRKRKGGQEKTTLQTQGSSLDASLEKLAWAMTPPWARRMISALETSALPP